MYTNDYVLDSFFLSYADKLVYDYFIKKICSHSVDYQLFKIVHFYTTDESDSIYLESITTSLLKYAVHLITKSCGMNSSQVNNLLYHFLVLFLLMCLSCKQSETEPGNRTIGNSNLTDSISDADTLIDYRKLCLQNPAYYLADSLYTIRKLNLANPYYVKAAMQFEDEGLNDELIYTLNRLAWSSLILGNKAKTKELLTKIGNLSDLYLHDDHVLWAEIYRTKGNYFSQVGKYDESLDAYEHSLKILQINYGKKHIKVAEIYLLIGDLFNWYIMDHYNAIDNYFAALKIIEERPDQNKETYILCLYNLAVANNAIGELNKAKTYTIKLLQKIDIEDPALRPYLEFGNSFLAIINYSLGDYSSAIKCHMKSIELNTVTSSETNVYIAYHYNNLGLCYLEIDSISKGIENCEMAINIFETSALDSSSLSDAYDNLSFGYKKSGNYKIAFEYLFKCLKIRKKIYSENHEKTSKAYLDIGDLYLENGNIDSSIHYLKKSIESGCDDFQYNEKFSLPGKTSFGENYYLIYALNKIADIHKLMYEDSKQLEHLQYSMNLYLLCDSLIDSSRNHLDQEDSKLRFASSIQGIYENAINTAYLIYELDNDIRYFAYLYHFMEKNRARILLDNIHSAELISKSPIPDSIYFKQKRYNYQIRYLNQLITEVDQTRNSSESDSLNAMLFDEFRGFERLQEYIKNNYPVYYKMQYQFESIDFESLISEFPNTTFIEFFYGEEAIYAIKFDKDARICHKIKMDPSIEKSIRTLIDLCCRNKNNNNSDLSSYIYHAHYLCKTLFSPLFERTTFKSTVKPISIQIIPDGLISYVPFEALIKTLPDSNVYGYNNLDYLINYYDIGYSFSCNFLSFTHLVRRNDRMKDILAFGYYGGGITLTQKSNQSTGEVSLVGAKKELDAISAIFSGKYLTGTNATESNFRKLCTDYDAIHLAIHGTYDSLNNYNTCLIFNSINDTLEDGKLYNYDLFPIKLDAQLAVLSACETGLGKNNPGEGLLSMGWSFAYAGCKALVMSLWKADDQSTSTLMKHFYKQLSATNNINASLTNAKRTYLSNADEYTSHPKYWAAFVNYGTIIPSGKLKNNQIVIYIILGSLAVIITLLFKRYSKKNLSFFKHKHNHK